MAAPAPPPRKRPLITWEVLVLLAAGVFSFHYRDMTKPLPSFASLKQIPAEGMRYELGKSRSGSQFGFEFYDRDGKRYQTRYLDEEIAVMIDEALRQGNVELSIGPWQSALESNSIFTIYHMTQGERILIDYNRAVVAKDKEQKAALPVMAISSMVFIGIFVWVHKKQSRG